MNNGRLIVLVGIDGSGKTTQAELLVEDLKKRVQEIQEKACWAIYFNYLKIDSQNILRILIPILKILPFQKSVVLL